MAKKKTLTAPFLYVFRNVIEMKIGAVNNISGLSRETGLSYVVLKRVFLREMRDIYLEGHYEIWRLSIVNIKVGRRRGREFPRSTMSW